MNTIHHILLLTTFALIISCGPKINQPETKVESTSWCDSSATG